MSYKTLATYRGGYSRTGTIRVLEGCCDVCSVYKLVIAIDSSEEEYEAGLICRSCVNEAIEEGLEYGI